MTFHAMSCFVTPRLDSHRVSQESNQQMVAVLHSLAAVRRWQIVEGTTKKSRAATRNRAIDN